MAVSTTRRGVLVARSTSVDEAHRLGTAVFHPHRLEVRDGSRRFGMRLRAVTSGPVTVGTLSYAAPVDVETDDMETAYEINLPLAGHITCRGGDERVVASPERAVVFRPFGRTSMTGIGRDELLGVKLDRAALEARLAGMTGRQVADSGIATAPVIDLTTGRGREWGELVRAVARIVQGSDDPRSPAGNELVMRPLMEGLLCGVLFAVEHPFTAQLGEPARPDTPASVRRAEEFVHDHAAEPLSVTDIAAATGLSVRGLQASFRQHLQQTPMEYLRDVRVRRAHDDLITADPHRTTVADVAHRWGFTHVGRFAARYRAVFGCTPSQTLWRAG